MGQVYEVDREPFWESGQWFLRIPEPWDGLEVVVTERPKHPIGEVAPLRAEAIELGLIGTSAPLRDAVAQRQVSATPTGENPHYRPSDRLIAWHYDESADQLVARVPIDDAAERSLKDGIWLEQRFCIDDGELRRLSPASIHHAGGEDPVSYLLGQLGLRQLEDQLRRSMRTVARSMNLGDEWEQVTVARKGRSRTVHTDLDLAQWAARFVEALEENPRSPYKVLAERFPDWSDPAYRKKIELAREQGMLTKPGKGKTGGHLTDKAERLLRGDLGNQWAGVAGKQDTTTEDDQ